MSEIAIPGTQSKLTDRAKEYLLASLVGVEDEAVSFADDQYIDWSTTDADSLLVFECCDRDKDIASMALTRNDIESLQRALTLWLLSN